MVNGKYRTGKNTSSKQQIQSHLLSDLGFPLQGERHQFMSDAVPLLAVDGAVLYTQTRSDDDTLYVDLTISNSLTPSASSHLSFHLQLLQLPLVGPLAECFVDLGHDGNLFAAVINDHLTFGLL